MQEDMAVVLLEAHTIHILEKNRVRCTDLQQIIRYEPIQDKFLMKTLAIAILTFQESTSERFIVATTVMGKMGEKGLASVQR